MIAPAPPHAGGPASSPRQSPTAPSAAERSAPEPPPIEITIGHIEVRAPQAPPQRTAPAPSRLAVGLSDYLQQRNEGNR